MNDSWNILPSREVIMKTAEALQANGIAARIVETGAEAKAVVLEAIPDGAWVMNMTSVTLETIGVVPELLESGRYQAVRNQFEQLDPTTEGLKKQQLGAAPEWAVGSVHAVTQDGHVLIASNTGSQLPAYAYGAPHVLWVVGAQKIVTDFAAGLRRIYEHSLPLESERARKAYGTEGSNVSKLLVVNEEVAPERISIILVNEVLGF